MLKRSVFITLASTCLGILAARASSDCSFSVQAIAALEPKDQCAVRALSESCSDRDRCHAKCLIERASENVGGGCAHICGLIELSHPSYDCYPGSREAGTAIATTFALSNESDESIRVSIEYKLSPVHDVRGQSDCLRAGMKLGVKEQIGKDSYLVDQQGNVRIEAVEPTLEGTASSCVATTELPAGKVLLHETSIGYWFSEIQTVQVRAKSGSYLFSRSEIPLYPAPAESVFTWHVWRHPYNRRP
jgi:hypothetical protein